MQQSQLNENAKDKKLKKLDAGDQNPEILQGQEKVDKIQNNQQDELEIAGDDVINEEELDDIAIPSQYD